MPTSILDQNTKRTIHPGVKIAVILTLVIIAILAAAWWYWTTHKKQIVRNKLEKVIKEKTDGLYSIVYDDINIDEIGGNLSIKNMRIGYDSIRYASLSGSKETPSVLLKINIPEISITGVKTTKALAGKKIVGKKLLINNPYILVTYTNTGKHATRNIPTDEVYKQLLGDLDLIKIDTVEITNARIVTKSWKSSKDSVIFSNTNILLGGLAVDSLSNLEKDRFFFSKTMDFSCESINWSAPSGLYNYGISKLNLQSATKNISIARVDIDPALGEEAFVKQFSYQEDRFNVHFSNINIKNVDFNELMKEVIVADVLEVGSTSIKDYRDLRIPWSTKSQSGTYPHQVIVDLPISFVIKRAEFPGSYIEIKELNDISGKTGAAQFTNCNISINNLTNEPAALRRNNSCRVDITGTLMSLVPMKVTFTLPLGDKEGRFSVEGSSAGVDAVKLNKITEPTGMTRFRSGTLKSLRFKLSGNNTQASGTVTVLYNDLKIDILELDEDTKNGFDKKDVTSFGANLFIKDHNPKPGEEIRTIQVTHARAMNRSLLNLVWKTILEGMNLTIGNKKPMKRP